MISLYFSHLEQLQAALEKHLAATGHEQLLIGSGALHHHFLDDTRYPFRPNPWFVYWASFLTQHPDCWLLLRPGCKPHLFYYTPRDFWHLTPALPADEWAQAFEWTAYDDLSAVRRALGSACTAIISEQPLSEGDWDLNPDGLMQAMNFDRAIKTEWEQHCLREANVLAVKGHRAAREGFESGLSEYAIHQAYLSAIDHNEPDLPYDNIVGLNEHAAVLHYQFQQRMVPKAHRTLLIDAGARYNGYAADITRTHSPAGTLFADLIDALDEQQQALCARINATTDFVSLHEQTHRVIARLLAQFDIVHGSEKQLVEQGVTRSFYPHGLGHLLGLQVHDVGGWQQDALGTLRKPPEAHPFLRLTRPLAAGFAITVEPGLYFIPQLLAELKAQPAGREVNWSRVEELLPYGGIRIEDNLIVGEHSSENLTRDGFARLG